MSDDRRLVLDDINVRWDVPTEPDAATREEKREINRERKAKRRLDDERRKSLVQKRRQRETYAGRLYKLIVVWLSANGALVVLSGFKLHLPLQQMWVSLTIPDNILLAMIGGTTVNVLGLFYVVVRYLFSND